MQLLFIETRWTAGVDTFEMLHETWKVVVAVTLTGAERWINN